MHRMFSPAYWTAVDLVSRRTAPLELAYADPAPEPGLVAMMPAMDEMLIMDPPPAVRIAGMAARVPRKTPLPFTSMIWSQTSVGASWIRGALTPPMLVPPTPALLTRMSSLP